MTALQVAGAVGVALVLWGLVALLRHVRKVRILTELIEAIRSEDLHHLHWSRCAEWSVNDPASWLKLLQMLELRDSPVPPVLLYELQQRSAKLRPPRPRSPEAKAIAEYLRGMPALPYRDPLRDIMGNDALAAEARGIIDGALDAVGHERADGR